MTMARWNGGSDAQRITWLSAAGVHASLAVIFIGKRWSELSNVVKGKLMRAPIAEPDGREE